MLLYLPAKPMNIPVQEPMNICHNLTFLLLLFVKMNIPAALITSLGLWVEKSQLAETCLVTLNELVESFGIKISIWIFHGCFHGIPP